MYKGMQGEQEDTILLQVYKRIRVNKPESTQGYTGCTRVDIVYKVYRVYSRVYRQGIQGYTGCTKVYKFKWHAHFDRRVARQYTLKKIFVL